MENVLQNVRSSIDTKSTLLDEVHKAAAQKDGLCSRITSIRSEHAMLLTQQEKIHEIRKIKKKIDLLKLKRPHANIARHPKKIKIFVDDKISQSPSRSIESYQNLLPNRNSTPKRSRGLAVMNNHEKKRRHLPTQLH